MKLPGAAPGLVTFITAGDPGTTQPRLKLLKALPGAGGRHHRARHAVFRPHGRRAGDPGLLGSARLPLGQEPWSRPSAWLVFPWKRTIPRPSC
jgi:hypothetical protein